MSSRQLSQLSNVTESDWLKQCFDVLASIFALILFSPVFLFISIAIKIDSPGPILYKAARAGKDGRLFQLYKFRTMVANAAEIGPAITAAGDKRITKIGRILRNSKLDELPQLINILKGEMRLVGPRPEDPRYVAFYSGEQRQVLSVHPGITGPASLAYRQEEKMLTGINWEEKYQHEILQAKLAIDLDYLSQRTFFSDLRIIFATMLTVFSD